MKEVRLRPLDWDLLPIFGAIHLRLKKKGRALSLVDKLLLRWPSERRRRS